MSNGQVCCILGVCCPPGSDAQRIIVINEIQKMRPTFTPKEVAAAADRVLAAHGNFYDVVSLIDER